MSRVARKFVFGVLTSSDTIRAVQPQKMARGLKFRANKIEGLYYLCSENKGADQLRSSTAELICVKMFSYLQKAGFLMTRLIYVSTTSSLIEQPSVRS